MKKLEFIVTKDGMGQNGNRSALGGKAYNLARLAEGQLEAPDFFVLTQLAFFKSLSQEGFCNWSELSVEERCRIVEYIAVCPKLLDKIHVLTRTWGGVRLAVRSSAVDEDGTEMSYAGQFASVLNVNQNNIASAIETVWKSAFTKQVIAYRKLNGIDAPPEPPCVIVQKMVDSKLAGVAFGADPLTGDRDVVAISSVEGLGDKLVSGEVDSATYRFKGTEIVERLNESNGRLNDKQLRAIKELVDRAEDVFTTPQDVEWTIDRDGKLFILQARPITTLKPALEENGSLEIFDNSNIGESYPGMTTPLTYSFARKAYQHVYEEFCRLMGVTETAIDKHSHIFPRMLGFVRGRIYYNLLNWYRLLSLFPGFKTNRGFMEQMMGVKAGLPEEFLAEFNAELPLHEKVQDALSIGLVVPKLIFKWINLPYDINGFNARVEKSFKRVPSYMSNLRLEELAKLYRSLEQDLLLHWDAPIVNDFFAMVSFGLLRGICAKWFPSIDGLHNQLLCGETGIISTEPVSRMKELAAIAAQDENLLRALATADSASLKQFPLFNSKYESYLEKFGDRCTGELKLESPTLVDNPTAFLTTILNMAEELRTSEHGLPAHPAQTNRAQTNRSDAEALAKTSLATNFVRAFVFNLILDQTRTRIRERENLRFMRTRVFGIVRKIFVAIGKEFESRGLLDNYSDIFYLETEEVLQYIEGTTNVISLKAIANSRKQEFESYKSLPSPPDRFTIRNGEDLNDASAIAVSNGSPAAGTEYKGLGCCPGIVSGYARVIDDPETQSLNRGEILIAKRTDPGWITVIAQAKGIVVEYGSLLSHTAIVARELGIPTIVSVSNVTTSVQTGDWLEINGATGEVRVMPPTEEVALVSERECIQRAPSGEERQEKMESEIESKAGFSFVRYAQCWEDTDIVLEAMSIKPGDTCLSIASAGDNSLAMLAREPKKVVALDLNPAQLALLEIKVAAFRRLDYTDMMVLLGYKRGSVRLDLYEQVKHDLSPEAFAYWEEHQADIEYGIARSGKFERYFALFRNYVLPFVHSRKTIDALLKPKTREQREAFFAKKWDTLRWRSLFKLFFSELVMGKLGRDPSFFQYAEAGLAETLLRWVRKALVDQDPSRNPYLHWILNGEFGSVLPNYLRRENFYAIKRNIDKIEWHEMSVEEYLSTVPAERFDSFNLSDIFEYMSEDNYKTIMKLIANASNPGAKVVYWNMMAPRTGQMTGMENLRAMDDFADRLFAENKTFFYTRFVVDQVVADLNETSSLNVLEGPPKGWAA